MVKNFAYLIDTYGHIPNGNRSYYIGRSQPPFFAAMVQLLASIKGDNMYVNLSCLLLEKEYQVWMDGASKIESWTSLSPCSKIERWNNIESLLG